MPKFDEPQKTKYMLPVYTYPFKSNKTGLSSNESFFQSFLTKKGKVTKKRIRLHYCKSPKNNRTRKHHGRLRI